MVIAILVVMAQETISGLTIDDGESEFNILDLCEAKNNQTDQTGKVDFDIYISKSQSYKQENKNMQYILLVTYK